MPTNAVKHQNPLIDFSVLVPVYNSEKTLQDLLERIDAVFKRMGRSYELVLTDDGSTDKVWSRIESLHSDGYPVRAFRLTKNHGQHYALKCCLDHCVGQYAITMDDDLQHPPEEIPKLIQAAEANPDLDVLVGKYATKKHSRYRNLGTLFHTWIRNKMFPHAKGLSLTSFRIINRSTIDHLKPMRHANPRIGLMILSVTTQIQNIDVAHHPRRSGRSGYTLAKMLKNSFDNMINYSSIPLRAISALGIGFSGIAMILACYYLLMYLFGEISRPGFTTLAILLLLIGGILMFSFGLIGEYLARIVSQQLLDKGYYVRTQLR